jgi:predicted RNase H-like nuclease (RuvC/YqgF family)
MTIEEAEKQIADLKAQVEVLEAELREKEKFIQRTLGKAMKIIGRLAQDLADNEQISEGLLTDIAEAGLS